MARTERHIPFLDCFRGGALLLVFLFHAFGTTFQSIYNGDQLAWSGYLRDWHAPASFLLLFPASLGWIGVAVFFVISGFCIHLSHARVRGNGFVGFFVRRFFRLFPAYLVAVLFFALAAPFVMVKLGLGWMLGPHSLAGTVKQIAGHLLFVHNFSDNLHWALNGSFWSIAVEVQLYLLYPALIWLATRLGWTRTLALTAAIELGLRGFGGLQALLLPGYTAFPDHCELVDLPVRVRESPLFFWFSWSIGAALADAYLQGRALPFRRIPVYVWPLAFLLCYEFKPLFPFCFTLASLGTAALVAQLLARPDHDLPRRGVAGFFWNQVRWAGVVSYSAYLLHQPLLTLFRHTVPDRVARLFHAPPMPLLSTFLLCALFYYVIFALSYALYRFVELPGIALGRRVLHRPVHAPGAPTSAYLQTDAGPS